MMKQMNREAEIAEKQRRVAEITQVAEAFNLVVALKNEAEAELANLKLAIMWDDRTPGQDVRTYEADKVRGIIERREDSVEQHGISRLTAAGLYRIYKAEGGKWSSTKIKNVVRRLIEKGIIARDEEGEITLLKRRV